MRQTMAQLIDTAFSIKTWLGVGSYEMNHYEDGSYIDFRVPKIYDVDTLLKIAGPLKIYILYDENAIIIRLFENFDE